MENKKLYTLKTFDWFEYVLATAFFSIMAYVVHPKIHFIWVITFGAIALSLITYEVKTYFELYENHITFKKPFSKDVHIDYREIERIEVYTGAFVKGKQIVKFYYGNDNYKKKRKKKILFPKGVSYKEFTDILKRKGVRIFIKTMRFNEPKEI